MKYLRLDLLTLLISLFIFSSCQNSDTIGLDIDPGDSIISKLTDTAKVDAMTVREDSLVTSNLSQHPFGNLTDPVLGKTQANLAFALSLPTDAFSFGENVEIDSAVLVLDYGDEFYGDSLNSAYNIKVHQLTEKFSNSIYYNTKSWSYNTAEVGGKTVNRFAWNDSLSIRQIVKGGPDTLRKVAPQLRIPISSSFIASKFVNAGATNLATTAAFRNFLNGLYLTAQITGRGGLIFFNTSTANASSLNIYYRNRTSANVRDTAMASFGINAATTAAEIKHDYAGTPVVNILNKSSQEVYVQALGGLRTKVSFPYIKRLQGRGLAVNKAELVVNVVNGTESPLAPAKRLVMYRTDIAGQRTVVRGTSSFDQMSYTGAIYDKAKKRYVFNITGYVQGILNNSVEQYGLYIAPIDYNAGFNDPNIAPSATTAMRSVLGGTDPSSVKMKLNIYYTQPE